MLEEYFVKPETIDRVRGSWIGPQVESYVEWMAERGYRARNVQARVPVLIGFGEFARGRGARTVEELPAHIDAFVAQRVAERGRARARSEPRQTLAKEVRGPIVQMLSVVLPGFGGAGRRRCELPFDEAVPGFFEYLVVERGLRPSAVESYRFYLDRFEAYLSRVGRQRARAVAGAAQLLCHRARLARPGQDDGAQRLRCAAGFPALRPSPRRAGA